MRLYSRIDLNYMKKRIIQKKSFNFDEIIRILTSIVKTSTENDKK